MFRLRCTVNLRHIAAAAGVVTLAALGLYFAFWRKPRQPVPIQRSDLEVQLDRPQPGFGRDPGSLPNIEPVATIQGAEPRVLQRELKYRDAAEWQGMLVNLSVQPYCTDSAHCSLARACKAAHCTACESDTECASGELCVLDHCVRADDTHCRHKSDCSGDSLCVLTGYSHGNRGNEDMEAKCLDLRSGAKSRPPLPPTPEDTSPRSLPFDDEVRRAREFRDAGLR